MKSGAEGDGEIERVGDDGSLERMDGREGAFKRREPLFFTGCPCKESKYG